MSTENVAAISPLRSRIATNAQMLTVDWKILRHEICGAINAQSSWGNRAAEGVIFDAISRANVRTAIGQTTHSSSVHHHLQSERSGLGELYGLENAFNPHIFEIILSAWFYEFVGSLPDKQGSSLPTKHDVLELLVHSLERIASSRLDDDDSQKMIARIRQRPESAGKEYAAYKKEQLLYLIELAKELASIPRPTRAVPE